MIDILIVEDNMELAFLLRDFLENEGYSTAVCGSGEEALEFFRCEKPRLVVLDIILPSIDGFTVCREIRESSIVPIIIVSAKSDKDDKLNGLILGADDYIEKPYDIDILIAKIRGIFKRRYDNDVTAFGNIRINKSKRTVYKNDSELALTSKEFDLLLLLAENCGKTLSKEHIFNKIWGLDSESEPQTLTVHIKWLRQKIEIDPKFPKYIQTVWGVGYRLDISQ